MYCKRCGTRLPPEVAVCPECGARQRRGPTTVRCAYCGGKAAIELTVCPHCGRNFRPAGIRWGTVLLTVGIVVVAGAWALGRLPVEEIRAEVQTTRARLASLVQIAEDIIPPSTVTGAAILPTSAPAVVARPTVTATRRVAVSPTRPAPTPTTQPSPSPSATAAETGFYTVQPGDTLSEIADRLGISWQTLAALNGLGSGSLLQVGQRLRLPTPTPPSATATPVPATATPATTFTPTVVPTPTSVVIPTAATRVAEAESPASASTATPTPSVMPSPTVRGQTTYRLQAGDTLVDIAARYGVDWRAIVAANRIEDVRTLRVGQELIIPPAGATLAPTNTPRPRPTATPLPPTSPPVPLLKAPVLLNPGDGTPFSGEEAFIELTWQGIEGMPLEAQYRVTVEWVEGGVPQIPLQVFVPSSTTSVRLPLWLHSKADPPARSYTWSVQAVSIVTDGKGGQLVIELSPSSPKRVLFWN